MKKLSYILLALIVAIVVLLYLNKQALQKAPSTEPANVVVESPPQPPETNLVEIESNVVPAEVVQQLTNTPESIRLLTNALTATNIEQWKMAIKGLRKSLGLSESWDMEMKNLTSSVPVNLEENGHVVSYKAQFIDISIKNEAGDIREVEMHSPMMDIDETRELGLQLCNMFGVDSADFTAWCDKVGNHWVDTPLFGSRDIHDPNGSAVFAFQTLRGYNDEKPWLINFMIIPNP